MNCDQARDRRVSPAKSVSVENKTAEGSGTASRVRTVAPVFSVLLEKLWWKPFPVEGSIFPVRATVNSVLSPEIHSLMREVTFSLGARMVTAGREEEPSNEFVGTHLDDLHVNTALLREIGKDFSSVAQWRSE